MCDDTKQYRLKLLGADVNDPRREPKTVILSVILERSCPFTVDKQNTFMTSFASEVSE